MVIVVKCLKGLNLFWTSDAGGKEVLQTATRDAAEIRTLTFFVLLLFGH